MDKNAKTLVIGHKTMVGAALIQHLNAAGYNTIITDSNLQADLTNQMAVQKFFAQEKPEYVFLTTVEEGGIFANMTCPADLIYKNLQIQSNVIHSAWNFHVKKLIFLGSSCMYPKVCAQPIKEEFLLAGAPEPTSEAYAVAKIAGIKMCIAYNRQHGTNFISIVPTNIYGPGDNFDLKTSHVLPALVRKFHDAKLRKVKAVEIWGSGTPQREFLYVDDFADACLFLMDKYNGPDIINVGHGSSISIKDLALMAKETVGFAGELIFDTTKPDGAPNKQLDISKINTLGWKPKIDLKTGLKLTYEWFRNQENKNE